MSAPAPVEVDVPDVDDVADLETPWIVLVWNDPINLMSYVTHVFQKLFGYSREKATALMLDVHQKGRAVVASGSREKCELDVFRLHEHGLWATMQADWGVVQLGKRVRRTRKGDFEIRLPAEERDLLRTVVPQLVALLDEDLADPALRRLFPTAYADDPAKDAEYQQLVRDELADRRRASARTMLDTVDATRVDQAELEAWMGAVNDLRLVLGTRLDVSEETDMVPDPDDPDAALLALYAYLGFLLESMVDAVS